MRLIVLCHGLDNQTVAFIHLANKRLALEHFQLLSGVCQVLFDDGWVRLGPVGQKRIARTSHSMLAEVVAGQAQTLAQQITVQRDSLV